MDGFRQKNFIKNYFMMKVIMKRDKQFFNTDELIVDEISMLSMKIFDTLEYVCRKLRNKNTYFGLL